MAIIKRTAASAMAVVVSVAMIFGMTGYAHAAKPDKENVEYKGSGIVNVDFVQDVEYGKTKVKVKDQKGKSYKTSIIEKDNDDIEFKVKGFKKGRSYSFKITKVRAAGTEKYSTVKGSFKIPGEKGSISKKKAKSIAVKDAVRDYKVKKKSITDLEVESDTYRNTKVWEVTFDAKKKGKDGWYEYEYEIRKSDGKILFSEEEAD